MEHQSLRLLLSLACLLGLAPIKLDGLNTYKWTVLNARGIWFLFVLVLNVLSAQTFILATYMIGTDDESQISLRASNNFLTRVGELVNAWFCVESYTTLACWLVSVPNFVRLVNAIQEYRQTCQRSVLNKNTSKNSKCKVSWTKTRKILRWIYWATNLIIIGCCFVFFVRVFQHLSPETWESSWLWGLLGGSGNEVLFFALMIVHFLLCELVRSLTVESMLTATEAFCDELRRLTEWGTGNGKGMVLVNAPQLRAQISSLIAIFKHLDTFVGIPALVITATHFVAITLVVFLGAFTFVLNLDAEPIFYLGVYVLLFGYGCKLVLITNAGESLHLTAAQLKTAVLTIPDSSVPAQDRETLDIVRRLLAGAGGEVEFQLSACKYFKLNRAMLISLFGAVCSYNVVLVQFQASFGGWNSLPQNPGTQASVRINANINFSPVTN